MRKRKRSDSYKERRRIPSRFFLDGVVVFFEGSTQECQQESQHREESSGDVESPACEKRKENVRRKEKEKKKKENGKRK